MKDYTVIWEDRWRTGSHHHCIAKRALIRCSDIKVLMESDYGQCARYIFEGFHASIGEDLADTEVVELT